MPTAMSEIVNAAYRKIGINTPSTADNNNAIEAFNNMVGIMGIEGLFPYVIRESFSLTVGQDTYTIGSGGTFNTVRPIRILSLFIRDSNDDDFPIKLFAMSEYNSITEKSQSGKPTKAYYIPEHPLAKIIFNYDADAAYTAFFEFEKGFTEVATTATTINFPNEYKAMFIYNLAVVLAEDKKINLPMSVYATAQYYKQLIDNIRAMTRITPKVKFDMFTGATLNIETGDYDNG